MKAILIDAINQQVREVDHDGTLESLRQLVSCEIVEMVSMDSSSKSRNVMYVDEEGHINGTKYGFLLINKAESPFAGNGLIVGLGKEGEDTDTDFIVEEVKAAVYFGKNVGKINIINERKLAGLDNPFDKVTQIYMEAGLDPVEASEAKEHFANAIKSLKKVCKTPMEAVTLIQKALTEFNVMFTENYRILEERRKSQDN